MKRPTKYSPQVICVAVQFFRQLRSGQGQSTLTLPMPVRRVYGNPQVRQQARKVALQRGPLVYCLEEADNGANLHNLSLSQDSAFRVFEGKGIFAHKMLIQAEGIGCQAKDTDALWQYDHSPVERQPRTLTFIPWFSWANRGEGEMRIWVDEGII